jgi:hypothetical protein
VGPRARDHSHARQLNPRSGCTQIFTSRQHKQGSRWREVRKLITERPLAASTLGAPDLQQYFFSTRCTHVFVTLRGYRIDRSTACRHRYPRLRCGRGLPEGGVAKTRC